MQTVAPLGSLHFQAVPRHLPQIASITITSSTDSSDRSQLAVDTASKESKQGTSTLDVLLKLHDQLQRGVKGHGSVSFSGVESGNIKVYVDTVSNPQEASVTGLEQTAISGKGWGISAFQPRTPQVPSLRNDCVSTSGSSTGMS